MNLIKTTFVVSLFTMFSRITGFLRDMVIAAYVDKWLCDIFIISTKLGNVLRKIFAEGAFHASFVPRFSDILHKRGTVEAQRMASAVFTFMFITLCLLCTLVLIFYHYVLKLVAPTFVAGSEQYALGIDVGRICFLYIIAASISAIFSGVLNAYNKFALSAAVQCIFNLTILVSVLVGPLCFPNVTYTMSVGVLLAGIWQTIWLWFNVKKHAFSITFRLKIWTPEVVSVIKNMLPGIVSAGAWQFNMLIDMRMATSLPVGTISYINFADRITQLPLSLIGIAIGTSLIVALSESISKVRLKRANSQFNAGILMITSLTLPISCAAFIFAPELITIVFKHGKFNDYDVRITSQILMGLLSGLPAYVLSKAYASAFFAIKNTKTPVKISIISMIANVIALYTLTPIFAHVGIALATSISSWINVILLHIMLYKHRIVYVQKSSRRKIKIQCMVAVLMSIFAYTCALAIRSFNFKWLLLTSLTLVSISVCFTAFALVSHKLKVINIKKILPQLLSK